MQEHRVSNRVRTHWERLLYATSRIDRFELQVRARGELLVSGRLPESRALRER